MSAPTPLLSAKWRRRLHEGAIVDGRRGLRKGTCYPAASVYRLIRPVLFLLPPEAAHGLAEQIPLSALRHLQEGAAGHVSGPTPSWLQSPLGHRPCGALPVSWTVAVSCGVPVPVRRYTLVSFSPPTVMYAYEPVGSTAKLGWLVSGPVSSTAWSRP